MIVPTRFRLAELAYSIASFGRLPISVRRVWSNRRSAAGFRLQNVADDCSKKVLIG